MDIPRVRRLVQRWYKLHARQFLWRQQHPDPYMVLVSETMLQQTQTSRVQEKLPLFLQQFPTIHHLAEASNATIIRAWQGMGYNSRALRLRDCARAVVQHHHAQLPQHYDALRALPGIGDYTATAILAFAYHQNIAVVDVNIRRVYSRLLQRMPTTIDVAPEEEVRSFASSVFPRGKSSAWHQAIMDIGALYCTARAPKCQSCPLAKQCPSAEGMAEAQRTKKAEPSHRGEPNRIWRGRIVEFLRSAEHGVWIEQTALMERVLPLPHSAQDEEWLGGILAALTKDGIIVAEKAKLMLKE